MHQFFDLGNVFIFLVILIRFLCFTYFTMLTTPNSFPAFNKCTREGASTCCFSSTMPRHTSALWDNFRGVVKTFPISLNWSKKSFPIFLPQFLQGYQLCEHLLRLSHYFVFIKLNIVDLQYFWCGKGLFQCKKKMAYDSKKFEIPCSNRTIQLAPWFLSFIWYQVLF